MKKLSLLHVLPLALLVACGPAAEEGNGAVTTRSHSLDAISAVYAQVRLPIDIEVGAEAQEVQVVLDDNLQDAVDLEVYQGTLNIGTTRPFVPSENTRVIIRVPELRALTSIGSGDVSLSGRQTAVPFLLEHSGDGNMVACTDFTRLTVRHHTHASLDVCVPAGGAALEAVALHSRGPGQVRWEGDAAEANVLLEGEAALTLQGQTDALNLVLRHRGAVDAVAFPAVDLALETSSVSLSRVHATGSANIVIASTGDVELSGSPAELQVSGDGGGELIEAP